MVTESRNAYISYVYSYLRPKMVAKRNGENPASEGNSRINVVLDDATSGLISIYIGSNNTATVYAGKKDYKILRQSVYLVHLEMVEK